MAANSKAAAAKAAPAKAASSAADDAALVVMAVLEPLKYRGKRYLPGEPLLAVPDDLPALIDAGLAEVADLTEAGQ
ncbi:hypothetical protein [Azonexus sp.]|uniref:hypothetical protein n=1 Tax=Azonexus sp. TaxID=1872668 RepID=UPI0027B8D470|nr:hypothetical protein [Azonexus sp.]